MSKEVKVGLGVIFSLTLVFGFTVYDRFFQADPLADAAGVSETATVASAAQSSAVTQIVAAETSMSRAPQFDVAPAAQWEETPNRVAVSQSPKATASPMRSLMPKVSVVAKSDSGLTTFRAVEKPVLETKSDGGSNETPSASAVAPAEAVAAASNSTEQNYRPAPLSVQPFRQSRVRPAAAEGVPSGGYQPPRVLSPNDAAAQQPQLPTQQSPVQQSVEQSYAPIAQRSPASNTAQEAYRAPTTPESYSSSQADQRSYGFQEPPNTAQTDYRQTAQTAPSRGNRGSYRVGPNDTFWTISQKVYGSGSFFKALAQHNAAKYPAADQLAVGDVVETPTQRDLMQRYPGLCPKPRGAAARGRFSGVNHASTSGVKGRAYEVQEGDTLFDIARYELGDGSRWIEIYQLNQRLLTQDFDYIKPGMKIMLPGRVKRQPRESVARQADGRASR